MQKEEFREHDFDLHGSRESVLSFPLNKAMPINLFKTRKHASLIFIELEICEIGLIETTHVNNFKTMCPTNHHFFFLVHLWMLIFSFFINLFQKELKCIIKIL